mgnify:CR=1 FL=1
MGSHKRVPNGVPLPSSRGSNDDIGCVGAVVHLHQVQVNSNGVPQESPATLTGSLCQILGGSFMGIKFREKGMVFQKSSKSRHLEES